MPSSAWTLQIYFRSQMLFSPPTIQKRFLTLHYTAQHEVFMQQERVHRLKIALRQAEATLKEMTDREEVLVKKLEELQSYEPAI